MATDSSILTWNFPWTERPGGLQSIQSQRTRQDWACTHTHIHHILKNLGWGLNRSVRSRNPFSETLRGIGTYAHELSLSSWYKQQTRTQKWVWMDRVTETDNYIKTMKLPQEVVFCFAWLGFFFFFFLRLNGSRRNKDGENCFNDLEPHDPVWGIISNHHQVHASKWLTNTWRVIHNEFWKKYNKPHHEQAQSVITQTKKEDPGHLLTWRHDTSDLYPLRLKIRESKGWKVPESKRNGVPLSHLCPKSEGTFKTLYRSSNSWCIVKTRETHFRPGKFYPKLR